MPRGRPKAEFDKRAFSDLISLGCSQQEICWFFRDKETGKPANIDTLSRWCKREYGVNFQEFSKQNKLNALRIQVRKNQLELSKKSPAMAIWLGKQYLGQTENPVVVDNGINFNMDALSKSLKELAEGLESDE